MDIQDTVVACCGLADSIGKQVSSELLSDTSHEIPLANVPRIPKAGTPHAFRQHAGVSGDVGSLINLDVSRFDAAPLMAFIAEKETNYGNEMSG